MTEEKNIPSTIGVSSEIGTLRRLMIHSPDSGLEKVVPSKAQDWLFEDIIHLESMRKEEYDYYVKLLLYFLDPDKVKGKLANIDRPEGKRNFYKPDRPDYFRSDKVIDPQFLLSEILEREDIKTKLVTSVCAVERCSYKMQGALLELSPKALAKTLLSGTMPDDQMLFPPVPNFIFTRDIGIVINNHILLNRPAKLVRIRESLFMKYIFYNHPYFKDYREQIIEVSEDDHQFFVNEEDKLLHEVTLEGGDVMIIHPQHLLIGSSERTTLRAINQVIKILFDNNIVPKVTVIKIPPKRDFMHIDTVFTQVRKNVWVIFGALTRQGLVSKNKDYIHQLFNYNQTHHTQILQFEKGKDQPRKFEFLEDLLDDISKNEFHCKEETRFIYSGGSEFPFDLREQWTDSCNVLALKEGVVVGYDRNVRTAREFENNGFRVVNAKDLIRQFEEGSSHPAQVENTLILIPSAELSRARGGSHCMSMPLLRDSI